MKLVSGVLVNNAGEKRLEFKLTKVEHDLIMRKVEEGLTEFINSIKEQAYHVPLTVTPKEKDIFLFSIKVDGQYKEKFVQKIISLLIQGACLTVDQGNEIFASVCSILQVKFNPIGFQTRDTQKFRSNQFSGEYYRVVLTSRDSCLFSPKPSTTQPKGEKNEDFGSGLTGLRGAFK